MVYMRKTPLAEGEYYHIYNRGVDKRLVFMQDRDYHRFLYLLSACNDEKPLLNSQFYYRGLTSIASAKAGQKGAPLVAVVCFCLMPNHFHFILKQLADGGISTFMQKVGTGYTMYFNTKYSRSGALFQGTFKASHIDKEEYLTHLTRYIHLNPAELYKSQRGGKEIKRFSQIHQFAKDYPWSTYGDYLGGKRFEAIIDKEVLPKIYESPAEYEKFVGDWMEKDLDFIADYTIEV